MTHTNHRRGEREALERDFVVLMMPQKGINVDGARAKLQRFFDLARDRGALNMSDGKRTTMHVLVAKTTTYLRADDKAATPADLKEGMRVVAKISKDGKTALSVKMAAPR